MRYCTEKKLIHIHAEELVSLARREISAVPVFDEDEPSARAEFLPEEYEGKELLLSEDFSLSEINFRLTAKAYSPEDGEIHVIAPVSDLNEAKRREVAAQYRGEAFVAAALLSERTGDLKITLAVAWCVQSTREIEIVKEVVGREKLLAFLEKCKSRLITAGKAEIERVTKRLPSMKSLKFPYETVRPGQDEFIRAAYRTIARGGELYATAPTGTGKTVCALFPATRALGDARVDKVFYLTPKSTTAEAARECILRFCDMGASIRAVILIAKDKLCRRASVCRESKKLCPTNEKNRISEAASALFQENISVVTPDDIQTFAEKFTVCPYELSLTYSELCDIVVCDFNYLFDPQVYIRRYFTRGGSYALLIDEAHNLSERAREMYSAEISLSELLCEPLSELSVLRRAADEAAGVFRDTLSALLRDEIRRDSNGKDTGAYHSRYVPNVFYGLFDKLCEIGEGELYESFRTKDDEAKERTRFIREYLFRVKKFRDAIARFDEKFEFFAFLEGEELRAKVFCLDTGGVIRERLDLAKSAVLFSGTLSPISYYKSVLGGDGASSTLSLDSPFAPEQLSVSVMHNITTRVSEREKSLPAIVRIIAATLSAKRGNYMIFSPSFAYSEALYGAFKKKYPKIRAILQRQHMSDKEKGEFLSEFSKEDSSYLAAFCVTGGIYSEGIDLAGDKLIGAVIVGIGMPALSFEREAIAAYYEEKLEMGTQYAYLYPGMNRVLQAAGRVIRTEDDRGVIVLIDDRFDDPLYKKIAPSLWRGMEFLEDAQDLRARLDEFWLDNE